MTAYYNEIDPYVAQWLKNLIAAGHIPAGDVDERSIVDVHPDDLAGYTQCHFFAGIAGWPYALRLAGWPDDKEVWTGSCPCQPLSCAGQRKGHVDERHLWPAFFSLISERRPAAVFGEQVSGKDGLEWLSAVRADLEGTGYAVGAADLPACSVGAPHIRRRLFWVAHYTGNRWFQGQSYNIRHTKRDYQEGESRRTSERGDAGGTMEYTAGEQVGIPGRAREQGSSVGELGDTALMLGNGGNIYRESNKKCSEAFSELGNTSRNAQLGSSNPWSALEWIPCIDGKWRPTKPGLQPLAYGVPARVGKLRAAGNAIVPQVAAEFIRATM